MKLGITKVSGAGSCEISRLIFGDEASLALAGGSCPMTWPATAPGSSMLAVEPKSSPR